jgi:hypothetical protein
MGTRRTRTTHHERLADEGWAHETTTLYSKAFHSGFFALVAYVPEFGWGWSFRHRNCTITLASGFVRNLLQARTAALNEFVSYKEAARKLLEQSQGHHILAAQALRTRAGDNIDAMSPYKALLELLEDAENWDSEDLPED